MIKACRRLLSHGHGSGFQPNKQYLKNNQENSKFISLVGFDSVDTHHVHDNLEDYKYMINKPASDDVSAYYGVPGVIPPTEHPYFTDEPTGYVVAEDPYDTTSDASGSYAMLLLFFIIVIPINLKLRSDKRNTPANLFKMRLAAVKLEENIRDMRKEREGLQQRLDMLTKLNAAKQVTSI